jgi:MMP 1-O-methyltransferase
MGTETYLVDSRESENGSTMKAAVKKVLPETIKSRLRKTPKQSPRDFYDEVSKIGSDSPNEWIRKSSTINGWLFEGEHEFLWELASRDDKGDIAEIGTWMGKSACILAGACETSAPDTHLFCIDPFDMSGTEEQVDYHKTLVSEDGTFYQFVANAKRCGFMDRVIPVAAMSYQAIPAIPSGLRMAFIDGAHDYERCKADVDLMLPKLAVGGVIAIHDARNPVWKELADYVDNELMKDPSLREVGTVNSIVAFEKVS